MGYLALRAVYFSLFLHVFHREFSILCNFNFSSIF